MRVAARWLEEEIRISWFDIHRYWLWLFSHINVNVFNLIFDNCKFNEFKSSKKYWSSFQKWGFCLHCTTVVKVIHRNCTYVYYVLMLNCEIYCHHRLLSMFSFIYRVYFLFILIKNKKKTHSEWTDIVSCPMCNVIIKNENEWGRLVRKCGKRRRQKKN